MVSCGSNRSSVCQAGYPQPEGSEWLPAPAIHAGLFTTFKAEEMEVFKALERLCKDSVAAKAYSKAVLEVMKVSYA
eukprot:scaffold79071_cov14-Tisochrysis_lutea.AAC.1